jgi:hypothetical protein
MYTLHTDSSEASGRNLRKYKEMPSVGGGALDRRLTSHYLFCLQGGKNCSYVTERCSWMCADYLRHTGRREYYNGQMVGEEMEYGFAVYLKMPFW